MQIALWKGQIKKPIEEDVEKKIKPRTEEK